MHKQKIPICDWHYQNHPHICTQWQRIVSSPVDSAISRLSNHNTTDKSGLVCFFWGLLLRPVRHSQVLKCLLNVMAGLYRWLPCSKSPHTRCWSFGYVLYLVIMYWGIIMYCILYYVMYLVMYSYILFMANILSAVGP